MLLYRSLFRRININITNNNDTRNTRKDKIKWILTYTAQHSLLTLIATCRYSQFIILIRTHAAFISRPHAANRPTLPKIAVNDFLKRFFALSKAHLTISTMTSHYTKALNDFHQWNYGIALPPRAVIYLHAWHRVIPIRCMTIQSYHF